MLLNSSLFVAIFPSIFTRLRANTGTITLLGMIGRFALLGRPFAFHVVALCWGGGLVVCLFRYPENFAFS